MLIVVVLVLIGGAWASSFDPHPHQGVLMPFTGEPLPFTVTPKEEAQLGEGRGITKVATQETGDKKLRGGRGFALQDVYAPVDICLDTIADLPSYVMHVPSVKKVQLHVLARTQPRTHTHAHMTPLFPLPLHPR